MDNAPPREPVELAACVARATFYGGDGRPADYSHTMAMGMRHLHRHAARWYASRYFAEHGRLPEGRHQVKVWAYPHGYGKHDGIDNIYSGVQEVSVCITYPRRSAAPPDPPR
jgi:hypothetical protein